MSGYRDQKKCDSCGQWLDPLEKCGCLSTTPPPAPAGEREWFECWCRSEGIDTTVDGDGDYTRLTVCTAWAAWQARASSPAPALERRVPGGPACPTCGFKITVGKKPPLMPDDDLAPVLELTSEEQALYERCATRYPACSTADVGDLLAIISRLTTPADGENDRLTHEAANAPDERAAMELRYGLREEDLP